MTTPSDSTATHGGTIAYDSDRVIASLANQLAEKAVMVAKLEAALTAAMTAGGSGSAHQTEDAQPDPA